VPETESIREFILNAVTGHYKTAQQLTTEINDSELFNGPRYHFQIQNWCYRLTKEGRLKYKVLTHDARTGKPIRYYTRKLDENL